MSGTVVSVDAREGQTLNATYQTPNILRIADLTAMTVWTDVSEADVRRVRADMPVYFTTLGSAGQNRPGAGMARCGRCCLRRRPASCPQRAVRRHLLQPPRP